MKMRVYGFGWQPDHLPQDLPAVSVFERIETVSGNEFGDYLAAVTKKGEWWAGVLLKIRDPKAITTLRKQNNVLELKAETLKEGERLAEANFFIGHVSNGHGLYCHHYLSASLLGDFGYYCGQRFQEMRNEKMEKALSAATGLNPKKIRKRHRGRLVIEQILKPGTFDSHVKALKQITKLEANLVTFEVKQKPFQALTTLARRKKVVLGFDPNAPVGVIANGIVESRTKGLIDKALVVGKDKSETERRYRTDNDSQVFDEYDYAEVVSLITLRFNDLANSIGNSEMITRLIGIGSDSKVKALLGIS
jgi:hypothetical protein